ncbi:MAG: hypothetical protein ACRD2L_05950, partial [Terriglobia bacterium]
VLIGLVERSEHCRLVARIRKRGKNVEIRETRVPMDPGTIVLFNGAKLWHAVTPLGKGEERIVLTLQYVTKYCFKYTSLPRGSARLSRLATARLRNDPS